MTRVRAFWIDRTDVTNAEFARFVAATGYVTQAERPLDPRAYPGLSPAQLKPSAIVFVGSTQRAGSDPSQWWRVVPGANWRHPDRGGGSVATAASVPKQALAINGLYGCPSMVLATQCDEHGWQLLKARAPRE